MVGRIESLKGLFMSSSLPSPIELALRVVQTVPPNSALYERAERILCQYWTATGHCEEKLTIVGDVSIKHVPAERD